MRIVIDVRDDVVARWGSLFIHPLSYSTQEVRMYTPGFEMIQGIQPNQVFAVSILQSPWQMQAQQPTTPPQPAAPDGWQQQPQLPNKYPPPQLPKAYEPPRPAQPPAMQQIPPSYIPPDNQPTPPVTQDNSSLQKQQSSSQQPTPTDKPPLSLITPDGHKEDNDNLQNNESDNKDAKGNKGEEPEKET